MQIQKNGEATTLFLEELRRLARKTDLPPQEEQLKDNRTSDGLAGIESPSMEGQLTSVRKENEPALYETLLRGQDVEKNGKLDGTIETRLNDADSSLYPHRNDSATMTGHKRPINALPEELNNASEESRRKRYEKANKPGKNRILDDNVGSQKTSTFNLNMQRTAQKCSEYIAYKNETAGISVASPRHSKVAEIDSVMSEIMQSTQANGMNDDDKARIAALKIRKMDLLRGV